MTDLIKKVNNYVVRERSDYQLKHFVIGQHDTPEMQYRQILIEVKSLLLNIQHAELQIEENNQRIKKLESTRNEIKQIKAAKLRLNNAATLDALEGAKMELDYLLKLSKDYRHYTPAEIEAEQENYWELRLIRQASTDQMALEQGVGVGNLMSLMQAKLLQKALTP